MFEPHLSIIDNESIKIIDNAEKPTEWYTEKGVRTAVLDCVIYNNEELEFIYAKRSKKSEFDEILIDLMRVEYAIILAHRHFRKENKYFYYKSKEGSDLCEIHKKANHRIGIHKIDDKIKSITEKYLSSPWMHTPTITNALVSHSIDLQITSKSPYPMRSLKDPLFIILITVMIGLTTLFYQLAKYDFNWPFLKWIRWLNSAMIFNSFAFVCFIVFCLLLSYPVYVIKSNSQFAKFLKNSEPMLAVKKDVITGCYNGDALSNRLSLIEKHGIHPDSRIYSLLQLNHGSATK